MPMNSPFGSLDGATHLTLFAITQTDKLAEAIERYELLKAPLPERFIAGIDSLSSHLQTFRPDDDIPLFLDSGLGAQEIIHNNLEVAWYLSACIYFHNRINNSFVDDVSFAVNAILMCLLRAEEIKAQLEPDFMYRDYPVTFPAFVASCNAIDRYPWACWWLTIQGYGIRDVRSQWRVIQRLWELIDVTHEPGEVDFSWLEIMQGPHRLPLSAVFETLGFYY
ncbi:unnamed protein product [Penicillium egyptiacum]|uniref:Uncharacterized protein n=1 Tax=Penicillium egyptiacum TaxID=1303716 RepID=A0A9W4P796_9EURO|nr:unnamed protein product [Penicillium egyptiacum]